MSDSPTEASTEAEYAQAVASVEEQLGTLFRRARSLWKDAAAAVHPDLQPVGYKVLSALVTAGAAQTGALCDGLSIDKSVMSRQVRTLEEFGLVEVRPDPADGRARILEATPAGVASITAVRSGNQALLNEQLREWSPEELRMFAELLGRLATAPNPR